jgi:broad specificity phosphatase PhoE
LAVALDERLREKEFGILDRLTPLGSTTNTRACRAARPRRQILLPPGGGSWCDVILRLRSVIDTITRNTMASGC